MFLFNRSMVSTSLNKGQASPLPEGVWIDTSTTTWDFLSWITSVGYIETVSLLQSLDSHVSERFLGFKSLSWAPEMGERLEWFSSNPVACWLGRFLRAQEMLIFLFWVKISLNQGLAQGTGVCTRALLLFHCSKLCSFSVSTCFEVRTWFRMFITISLLLWFAEGSYFLRCL